MFYVYAIVSQYLIPLNLQVRSVESIDLPRQQINWTTTGSE